MFFPYVELLSVCYLLHASLLVVCSAEVIKRLPNLSINRYCTHPLSSYKPHFRHKKVMLN
uniref:Uncharacterized protein n=1 Tax=Anguilla anguilla TaxID=7936 RepID=A0A0E9PYQ5_ANGAN